jgi:hypothetical protein
MQSSCEVVNIFIIDLQSYFPMQLTVIWDQVYVKYAPLIV